MKFKFLITLVPLLLLALMLPVFASAASSSSVGIPLFFNGKELKPEVAPRIIKDVTMVPIRIIAEELGSKVEWNQAARKVSITKNSTAIEMVIDQDSATVNGTIYPLDAAPLLIDGNTLLPVRFVAENMGIGVNWNDVARAVYLQETGDTAVDKPSAASPDASDTGKSADGNPLTVIQTIDMSASQLSIKANSGALTPKVFTLQNPKRIVIDIPNVVLDPALYTNKENKSGETVSNNVYVANVRYSQFQVNPDAVRIVLDLKESMELQWESGLSTSTLVAKFQIGAKYKVVIDPGHGDQDPGAKAVNGNEEKAFNLAMGLKVYRLLQNEPSIEPYLTRNDDTFVPLDDRAQFANDRNADVFVSIHGNSYTASSTGTETYYYKSDSVTFAQIMHNHVTQATGLPDRGVRQQPFRVVKVTNMPAVLLEIGYLSNEHDTALMFDESFQNKVAGAIVAGIKEQLNLP